MAVTVLKTPAGHKIIDQAIEATITNSAGDALVTLAYHGLGTGDHVYVTSDIDDYAGFWYVTAIDTDTFKLSEYSGAAYVPYYQDLTIDYYHTSDHVWNSIYLPIVYKLSNDKWPVNTVDTARTISSTSDDNGYLQVTASGTLKTGIAALEYVKISNAADADYDGVWQVIEVISNSSVVIDAVYTATSLAGATIQYYYNNYQVKVNVYAGLPVGHVWEAQKPYELLAELSFTPDESNLSMFSISEYIKGKTEIKNNPTLFSMPLNLDAFTGFYISVAEDYDSSDGYTVTTDEGTFTNDSFEGYAITGKLPFKNTYAGDYADYIYIDGAPANWLTALDRLLAVEDKYFDISFIKNIVGDFTVTITKYIADYLTATEVVSYTDQGIGVYRIPITADAYYDSFCIQIATVAAAAVPGVESAISLPALALGTNVGTGTSWTLGANPSVSLTATTLFEAVTSKNWVNDYAFIPGYTYAFTPNIDYNNDTSIATLTFLVLDSGDNILYSSTANLGTGVGVYNGTKTFVAPTGAVKYGYKLSFVNGVGSNTDTIDINSIAATETTPGSPEVLALTITEEICIDLLESCEAVSGFTPTDIRLLEDGSYRILE